MKIAIISDTHDNFPAAVWIIEYLNSHKIPVALHAGDIINPGIIHRFIEHYTGNLHFVFGNNDGEKARLALKAEAASNATCHHSDMHLELDGKKIFMNHYSTIGELVAHSGTVDVAIGGHDHKYRVIPHGKSLFINPGNTVMQDKWSTDTVEKTIGFVILDTNDLSHERVTIPATYNQE